VFAVKPSVVLLLGAVFLAWCSPARTLAQFKHTGVFHPQERLYSDSDSVIERAEDATPASALTAYEDALFDDADGGRVGSREGREGTAIGKIEEVKAHDGRLYILDALFNEVKVYQADGRYLQSFARQGNGPGEIQTPTGMDIDAQGRIWIAEQRRRKVIAYQRTGEGYELVTEFRTKAAPEEVCVQGGNVYIYALSTRQGNTNPVFEYSSDGRLLRTFGPIYQSDKIYVAQSLSGVSSMECVPEGMIVMDYGELAASAVLSVEKGRVETLVKYNSEEPRLEEVLRAGRTGMFHDYTRPYELGGEVCLRGGEFVVSRRRHVGETGVVGYVHYRVDLENRTVVKLGDSDWQCQVFQNGHLVMSRQTPYPQIAIMEY